LPFTGRLPHELYYFPPFLHILSNTRVCVQQVTTTARYERRPMQPENTVKSKTETNPRFFPDRNRPDIHPVNGLASQSSKIPKSKKGKNKQLNQAKTTVAMQLGIVIIRKERNSMPMKCLSSWYSVYVCRQRSVYPPLGYN
jgi:hypothetical protein